MNEDKASRYHRLKRQGAVVSAALTALVLGGLVVSGASVVLRDLAESIAGHPAGRFSPLAVALYVVFIAVVHEATALPVTLYRTFLLDRRFGLSSERAASWFQDHAKGAVLGLALAVAGAEVICFSLTMVPRWWWLVSACAVMAVMALMARMAPVVLLPLFYSFRPLDRAALHQRLIALSERAGVPVLGIYEWGLGEKTPRANAALVGAGATRRIIVSDTLLSAYSDDEIEVILAHEIGHHVHRDIGTALLTEFALTIGAFYAASLALAASWALAGLRSPADVAGLPLVLLAYGAVSLAATPVLNALSRRNERRADRFALAMTRQPGAFISAMRRLAAQNLAEDRPSRAVLWLFHTHPPIDQRIDAARRFD